MCPDARHRILLVRGRVLPLNGLLQIANHKRFVNKASDKTNIRKREHQSSCSDYLIGFLFANSPIRGFVYKSFVNFNSQFVLVVCKLLRAISLSKLQYCETILQCRLQENNIRFDCNALIICFHHPL